MIDQAKGLLAERARITMDAAFRLLRGYAREHNRRLSQIAGELIDGRLDDAALTQPAHHPRTSER